jgi:hypothetical protein
MRALSENTEIKIEKLNKRNIFTVLHELSHAGAAGQGGHPLHEGGGRVHSPLGPALLLTSGILSMKIYSLLFNIMGLHLLVERESVSAG